MLDADDDILFKQIEILYPETMKDAIMINNYIKLTYAKDINNDEFTYLAMHFQRLMKKI